MTYAGAPASKKNPAASSSRATTKKKDTAADSKTAADGGGGAVSERGSSSEVTSDENVVQLGGVDKLPAADTPEASNVSASRYTYTAARRSFTTRRTRIAPHCGPVSVTVVYIADTRAPAPHCSGWPKKLAQFFCTR